MVRLVAFHQHNSPLMFAKETMLCIFGLKLIFIGLTVNILKVYNLYNRFTMFSKENIRDRLSLKIS